MVKSSASMATRFTEADFILRAWEKTFSPLEESGVATNGSAAGLPAEMSATSTLA